MCVKVQKYGDEREKYGRLKGQEEGASKVRIENANNMIALGKLTLEDVATFSGLPLSKVRELVG